MGASPLVHSTVTFEQAPHVCTTRKSQQAVMGRWPSELVGNLILLLFATLAAEKCPS